MRANGKHPGRPKLRINENDLYVTVERWRNGEITASYAHKKLGISRSSFYRIVKEVKV